LFRKSLPALILCVLASFVNSEISRGGRYQAEAIRYGTEFNMVYRYDTIRHHAYNTAPPPNKQTKNFHQYGKCDKR